MRGVIVTVFSLQLHADIASGIYRDRRYVAAARAGDKNARRGAVELNLVRGEQAALFQPFKLERHPARETSSRCLTALQEPELRVDYFARIFPNGAYHDA